MNRFAGKRVLVVGGGADGPPRPGESLAMGNGRAICLRLAAEGARLAISDLRVESAAETVAACAPSEAGVHVAIRADASDPDACRRAVAEAQSALGGLDVVVCNVGIASGRPLHAETVEGFDFELDVNLRSHMITAQAALPKMLDQGHGVFVFISSLAGMLGGTGIAYDTSKAALPAIGRHMTARYAKRGIRANTMMLGLIDSTMVRREFGDIEGRMDRRASAPPVKRQGRPEEVAAACAFLASDDASYVYGTMLVVDGGLSIT